jgi:hypothetical protein
MSLSDLTFSSPRKALSDKSDDEFEKFLNDVKFKFKIYSLISLDFFSLVFYI